MTKEKLERIKERIQNLIEVADNEDNYRLWNKGYNSACRQILELLEEAENQ